MVDDGADDRVAGRVDARVDARVDGLVVGIVNDVSGAPDDGMVDDAVDGMVDLHIVMISGYRRSASSSWKFLDDPRLSRDACACSSMTQTNS